MALQRAKLKGVADIVFCIDATGSMEECINGVKDNLTNFANSLITDGNKQMIKLNWRGRVLEYRDLAYDDAAKSLNNNFPFVNSAEELIAQMSQVEALEFTGGDLPESTLDAILYATLKSDWRPESGCTKCVVVFTDAATLPINEKTTSELGIPANLDAIKQVLMENKINLFIYGQDCAEYQELSKVPKTRTHLYPDGLEALKTMDYKEVTDSLSKTITATASEGAKVL